MDILNAITDADFVSRFVGERLMAKGLIRAPVALKRHIQGGEDPDSKLVFLKEGKRGLVVTISPPAFPEVVAEECLKAAQMRSLLGDLGAPILEPLDMGRLHGTTYAVLAYRKPLSKQRGLKWIDRLRMKHHVLIWLREIARQRSVACAISRYEAALTALGRAVAASSHAATLLRTAEKHLMSGRFAPRSLPMHGDLWKGNVLHGADSTAFTLVDWRGSTTDGFPIFDLVRAAESFGLHPRSLARELHLHCAALGCRMQDLPVYPTGALGHYATHLGEMLPAPFRTMADECAQRFSRALSGRDAPSGSGRLVTGVVGGES